jgi:hypothetical protein
MTLSIMARARNVEANIVDVSEMEIPSLCENSDLSETSLSTD